MSWTRGYSLKHVNSVVHSLNFCSFPSVFIKGRIFCWYRILFRRISSALYSSSYTIHTWDLPGTTTTFCWRPKRSSSNIPFFCPVVNVDDLWERIFLPASSFIQLPCLNKTMPSPHEGQTLKKPLDSWIEHDLIWVTKHKTKPTEPQRDIWVSVPVAHPVAWD